MALLEVACVLLAGPVGAAVAQPRQNRPAAAPPAPKSPAADARLEVVPGADGETMVAMEFYALDIDHLLRTLSEAAGVTIVKAEEVTGPVTVIAPEEVPLDVAFQIANSVLRVRGYTIVRTPTGIYKVVSIPEAIQSGLDVGFGDRPEDIRPGDELITQVVQLENLGAEDVANQLQSLLSEDADVVPTPTNSLIITDTATNVRRAMTIIRRAEDELAGGLKVFQLQYYDAIQMAELVDELILGRGAAASAAGGQQPAWQRRVRQAGRARQQQPTPAVPRIGIGGPEFAYPDERTNSLICLATPLHLRQIEELIGQLDKPVSLRDSYFVYPVQNLMASELASLVAPLIGANVVSEGGREQGRAQGGQPLRARGTQQFFRPPTTPPGMRVVPEAARGEGALGARRTTEGMVVEPSGGTAEPGVGVVVPPGPEAPQPARPPGGEAPPSAAEYPGAEPAAQVTGATVAEAVIAADDNTNTLLISAPPEQIDLLKQMLEQLDVMPPQVHIRAIIAEVTLSRDTSLGFGWEELPQLGPYGSEGLAFDFTTEFGVGAEGAEGLFGVITADEFAGVLQALTTDSDARILSAPSIFTQNNQKAQIDISQQIPVPTGTFQTTTQAGTISTSISYRSVGIVLDVVPRVTQGDVVQLEVSISANEPGGDVKVAGLDYPSINQRFAEAAVSVQAGHTVVLGGLMREQMQESASRVPLLGDLPLIGALFRSTTSRRLKSELLVFLTPQVVRTPAESARLTDEQKSHLPDIPASLRPPADQPAAAQQEVAPAEAEADLPRLPHYFGPFEPEPSPEADESATPEPEMEPPAEEGEEAEEVAPTGPEAPEEQGETAPSDEAAAEAEETAPPAEDAAPTEAGG